ncbi:MAG: TM0106 family RecB-like putative nuclease [Candidatus Paceibacterota bacterium]
MKKEILLGGYDAKSCPEKVRKNYAPEYQGIEKDPIPPGDLARMESGVRFETSIGEVLSSKLKSKLAIVPACDRSVESKALRESITTDLMREPDGVLVIWNARLAPQSEQNRTGEPDALVLVGSKDDGSPIWAPVDVKDHKSLEGSRQESSWLVSELGSPLVIEERKLGDGVPQKSDALQLAHYHRMLESLGFSGEAVGGIIGREGVIIWHKLDEALYRHPDLGKISALEWYDYEFRSRVEIAEAAVSGVALSSPEWKTECTSCVFRTTCHDELKIDMDHITLLPGITSDRAKTHYKRGVTSVAALARLDWRTAKLVDQGLDVASAYQTSLERDPSDLIETFVKESDVKVYHEYGIKTVLDILKLDPRTAAYSLTGVWHLAESIDRARVAKIGKVHLSRGVEFVKLERTAIEEDVDIEDANGYVYLIGVRTSGRKRVGEHSKQRAEYHSFVNWDQSPEGEARIFAEFWAHVTGMSTYAKSNKYGYRLYHYSKHEPTTFKTLASRHAGRSGVPTVEQVEAFFARKDVIDLYPLLADQLIWPTESNSLKELAKWVRFSWRDSDPGGGNSLAWYALAVGNDDDAIRKENQQRILDYNADDVAAQVALRDWLSRLGETRAPGKRLPNVSALDKRFSRRGK